MKTHTMFSALLLLAAGSVNAEPVQDFSEADANQDGLLSTDEAKTALPELSIEDMNNDGQVNVAEAQQALPTLNILSEANPEAPIGAAEYGLLVQAIESAMSGNS